VFIDSFHARIQLLSEVLLTNLAIVHCGCMVIPDHLQCLLAHGGSVNNKMLYQKHQETVDE